MAETKKVQSFGKIKEPSQLASKRREYENLRVLEVKEWALNRAFYKGNQWCFWNKFTSQVESLPVQDGDKPRWKVRLTSNQILPGVQHYVAQLTKSRPIITATPDSSAYRDTCAAEVAQSLFDYWWQELGLRTKLQRALINACISQGWWKIGWDPLAGKSMKVMLDPNTGQPITNEDLADAYRDQLREVAQQAGVDEKEILGMVEQTVYVGDIRVDVIPGENVLIDPSANIYTEAAWVICRHAMDVDEIKARWGKDVEPNTAPADGSTVPLAYTKRTEQRSKTVRDVYIGYFRPTATLPDGRYVVWIEEPDMILADTKWPYPFNDIPLVKFPGLERDDSAMDEPIVTHARPLQKELNRTLSQMIMHKDLTIKPQMIAPVGSLRQRLTDEPGAVFEYQPIGGLAPEWRPNPPLPASAFNILADIQQRIDRLFNRIPSARDQMPARVDAGYGIELIQEAVADQVAPVIARLEEALARAGSLMVQMAQEYYIEPRLLKIRGQGGTVQVKKFRNADLAGGFSFTAQAGSGLPRSRAGRQQQILELVDKQMINPGQALRVLDLADLKSVKDAFLADEDQAYREHDKLLRGEILNPAAAQQAMMAVNMAMQEGELDPMEAQMILQQAALAPHAFEDKASHIQIHGNFMKSPEFEQLPPEVQQSFIMHYSATVEALKAEAPIDPKLAPKVSINARATTSAPVMGEALRRSGINVTDEQVEEEPLETAVYDSMDKPDVESAGNDEFTLEEQRRAEEAHQASLEKGDVDLEHSKARAKREEEKHKNAERRADEQHRERVKQMRKPKPQGGK